MTASPPAKIHSTEVRPFLSVASQPFPGWSRRSTPSNSARGVEPLADGGDHLIALDDEVGVAAGHRAATAARVVVAEGHRPALDADQLAGGVVDDLDRRDERLEHDALLLGGVDLFGPRGHLGARAAVEDRHLLGAEAQGGAGRVDGGVAAADHRDALADIDRAVDVVGLEERERFGDALAVLARHADVGALRSADAEEHGLVAVVLQALQREVATERLVALEGARPSPGSSRSRGRAPRAADGRPGWPARACRPGSSAASKIVGL